MAMTGEQRLFQANHTAKWEGWGTKIASFPGSTPQLFSHDFSTRSEKSWGVEPGSEARTRYKEASELRALRVHVFCT